MKLLGEIWIACARCNKNDIENWQFCWLGASEGAEVLIDPLGIWNRNVINNEDTEKVVEKVTSERLCPHAAFDKN